MTLAGFQNRQVVPAVVTCFSSRQDRLFVASAKCLGLLRGYFDSQPEVLGQYGVPCHKNHVVVVDGGGLSRSMEGIAASMVDAETHHICRGMLKFQPPDD